VRESVAAATLAAQRPVDRRGDAPRRRQVRVAQGQADAITGGELERHLPLHDGAIGDAAGGRHATGDGSAGAAGADRPGRDGALRDGVNLPIRAEQRRDQHRAAGQVRRVAQGRDRDIDPAARPSEGRQVGGDHDGGDVARIELALIVARVHAEPFEHADQRLPGEDGERSRSPVPFNPTTKP
jgi:hypothetical protein